MSVLVMAWVFAYSPTTLGDRLVLLSLADYAHDDGTRAFPSVESLAKKARLGKSTARAALRRLEDGGHIVSEGAMPSGTISYRIRMGTPESGGGPGSGDRGPESSTGGPGSGANPSVEPSGKTSSSEERAREKASKLPDDFPEELKPHARRVFAILRDVADQHNAKEVTPRGVGLAIQGNPSRRFVAVAYELASWAQSGRDIKDAVGTYRTFLKRADRHAGIERFGDDAVADAGPNVHPIRRGGRTTAADYLALKGTMG